MTFTTAPFHGHNNNTAAMDDAYRVLGLSNNTRAATYEEIKNAYYRLALIHHPDRVSGNEYMKKEAQNRFAQISSAFQLLTAAHDEENRIINNAATTTVQQQQSLPPVLYYNNGTKQPSPLPSEFPVVLPSEYNNSMQFFPNNNNNNVIISGYLMNEPCNVTESPETKPMLLEDSSSSVSMSDAQVTPTTLKRGVIEIDMETSGTSLSPLLSSSSSSFVNYQPHQQPHVESNKRRRLLVPPPKPQSPRSCYAWPPTTNTNTSYSPFAAAATSQSFYKRDRTIENAAWSLEHQHFKRQRVV